MFPEICWSFIVYVEECGFVEGVVLVDQDPDQENVKEEKKIETRKEGKLFYTE